MYSLLLERPMALLVCWVAAEFVLVCLRSWQRGRRSGRAVLVGLAALPLLMVLSYAVVTSAEEVSAQCHALAKAADDGDMAVIAAGVAAEFETAGLTREAFLSRMEQTLTRVRVDHPRLSRFDVQTASDTSVATFSATCRVRSEEATLDSLPTRWRVSFRRRGDQWLITSIESIPVPPLNIRRVDEWLR